MKNIHEYLTDAAIKAEKEGIEIRINDGEDNLKLEVGISGAIIVNEMSGQILSALAIPLWVVQEFIDKIEDLNK